MVSYQRKKQLSEYLEIGQWWWLQSWSYPERHQSIEWQHRDNTQGSKETWQKPSPIKRQKGIISVTMGPTGPWDQAQGHGLPDLVDHTDWSWGLAVIWSPAVVAELPDVPTEEEKVKGSTYASYCCWIWSRDQWAWLQVGAPVHSIQLCSCRCRARKGDDGSVSLLIKWRNNIGSYTTLIPKLMPQGYLSCFKKKKNNTSQIACQIYEKPTASC